MQTPPPKKSEGVCDGKKVGNPCVRRRDIHNDLKIDPILDFMKIISKNSQILNELMQLPPYDSAVQSFRKRPRTMLNCSFESIPTIKRRRDMSTADENLDT
ncbi:hypothetical protein AVEN_14325-1 [Araneus ventricosus]|uniref:Uncharacterized protein n=1 Tax=Araneus ventricosus TaxID=182803 RepID=A0A4Y2USM8_ARAVE|nr:hypothetical protein AVEN_14325-1 [Araneus ventricosus]